MKSRQAFLVAALAALSACATPGAPVKSMSFFDGDVVANAPAGYCLDAATSRPARGFAVLAPCATFGGGDSPPPVLGVATLQLGVQESGAVTGAEAELRDILQTDVGATLLSSRGDAALVEVLDASVVDNTVTVHFADQGPGPISGLQKEEWRAFLDLNGRLATVAVRGLAEAPLVASDGAWLLDLIVTGLVAQVPPVSTTDG